MAAARNMEIKHDMFASFCLWIHKANETFIFLSLSVVLQGPGNGEAEVSTAAA